MVGSIRAYQRLRWKYEQEGFFWLLVLLLLLLLLRICVRTCLCFSTIDSGLRIKLVMPLTATAPPLPLPDTKRNADHLHQANHGVRAQVVRDFAVLTP